MNINSNFLNILTGDQKEINVPRQISDCSKVFKSLVQNYKFDRQEKIEKINSKELLLLINFCQISEYKQIQFEKPFWKYSLDYHIKTLIENPAICSYTSISKLTSYLTYDNKTIYELGISSVSFVEFKKKLESISPKLKLIPSSKVRSVIIQNVPEYVQSQKNEEKMKKVRNLFLLTTLLVMITGCAPFMMPADDYPADYDDIEWVEITKDEAEELFDSYSHKKIYKKAELYIQMTYRDNSVITRCKVEGDSYYEYWLDAHTYAIDHLTYNPDDWNNPDKELTFYKDKKSNDFVKISYMQDITEFYEIYEKGWLREKADITNGPNKHSYNKEYVDYK